MERMERVDVKMPTIEVTYKDLTVEARCKVVKEKQLPDLWNTIKETFKEFTAATGRPGEVNVSILRDVSGIIKPSRMTLLLGPPGCGKTTLLSSLAGKLNQSLKVFRDITYNGSKLDGIKLAKTTAYISQHDLHIPQMTVRETLDFSARYQGVGDRASIMAEVVRKEKKAGIAPDPMIDTYMKAISVQGQTNVQTDYMLKILGLESCSETMVGDAMNRGISGGPKKRLTIGEMMIGPARAFFMDEISNGLDSSTTLEILSCIQQFVHITAATALISLLQPAPETFELFDDIILIAEGKIIYQGPRELILDFFEDCGFRCPQKKGIAEFLHEVISEKDQEQYWHQKEMAYSFITADEFSMKFKSSNIGMELQEQLAKKHQNHDSDTKFATFSTRSTKKWELLGTCMARELLIMKRNSFVHMFKTAQLIILAFITITVFLRTQMTVDLVHASYYVGSLRYTIIRIMTNGIAELTLSIVSLPIFYKQRDLHFYPAWAYAMPAAILKIPFSLVESFIWTGITYYAIGYTPEIQRFFYHFFLLFVLHQASTSLFRSIASITRIHHKAMCSGSLAMVTSILFGGYILPQSSLPTWLQWTFWLSPTTYAEIGLSINEFRAPRWQKVSHKNEMMGQQVLKSQGLNYKGLFCWLSLGALCILTLVFNFCYTIALSYLHRRMVIPFNPLTMTFQNVNYYIDAPKEVTERGSSEKRLQLLQNITGALRPGILTALMGVSGAGKTTLMDVLCGRKTSGIIEGDIRIEGYPKVQATFARVSGYCEQNDVHSSQITIAESVMFSAWLRLPEEIDRETKADFVELVLEAVELKKIRNELVGIPSISGLSTEQRKRLTIAVELVANPSIIFMDEPTSGLDARAAAIVMRAVKSIVDMGRTAVCTIHQPSIGIFESFDELILMKKGGRMIYSGPIGQNSQKIIDYFERIPGVPKIRENYNPATWMLEITSEVAEEKIGIDFARVYTDSSAYWDNKKLVEQLSIPPRGSSDLYGVASLSQTRWLQFKLCLWKLSLSYWRSSTYNLVRLIFLLLISVLFAALFWQKGKKITNEQDLLSIMGSMHLAMLFLGMNNCNSVLQIIARERAVLYRELSAGAYSSFMYSLAQVTVEIPCLFILATIHVIITYPAVGYYWSASKMMWYYYIVFCTLLCFNYLGMFIMSISSNIQVASIAAAAIYTIFNLFSGFLVPKPLIPIWWKWLYYICPLPWSLNGLLTSQYGDLNKEMMAFGKTTTVDAFVGNYYGFHHNQLSIVALTMAYYPLVLASLFSFCIWKINFQRR
ncbi:pleiotropic drug resistance protein 3-like [Phalaenopsis equestris]|uniref:pleiotropic drug resistance protein 3-like n=1 Tax=Phalaenopsis equestris TaxID=78828 RepID=UPI0009E32404|nr:pleiotropic drug resistance protein 3-like [Phalaenopsis equestris]